MNLIGLWLDTKCSLGWYLPFGWVTTQVKEEVDRTCSVSSSARNLEQRASVVLPTIFFVCLGLNAYERANTRWTVRGLNNRVDLTNKITIFCIKPHNKEKSALFING